MCVLWEGGGCTNFKYTLLVSSDPTMDWKSSSAYVLLGFAPLFGYLEIAGNHLSGPIFVVNNIVIQNKETVDSKIYLGWGREQERKVEK